MQDIKTYADITKAANAMQKEREIELHNIIFMMKVEMDQAFREIFTEDGDERDTKHKTLVDIHAAHGVSIHDF